VTFVTAVRLDQAHSECTRGYGSATRYQLAPERLLFVSLNPPIPPRQLYLPFGACWNEKQTMSWVTPRSSSPGLAVLLISCSDNSILIRPVGSRESHEFCMSACWWKGGNSRHGFRWLVGCSSKVRDLFSYATRLSAATPQSCYNVAYRSLAATWRQYRRSRDYASQHLLMSCRDSASSQDPGPVDNDLDRVHHLLIRLPSRLYKCRGFRCCSP
jgi:hypothetical protein